MNAATASSTSSSRGCRGGSVLDNHVGLRGRQEYGNTAHQPALEPLSQAGEQVTLFGTKRLLSEFRDDFEVRPGAQEPRSRLQVLWPG